jgi:Domain of unknown function (DUF5615)
LTFKFLIDECLWPGLVQIAQAEGHLETTCVRDRGWSGMKDWALIWHVVEGDFTLVTHNAVDFRGPQGGPAGGLHAKEVIHAGLVCLVSAFPMTPARQQALFSLALAELSQLGDLVNRALEVVEDKSGEVTIMIYEIP